jgi:hypothetical protein
VYPVAVYVRNVEPVGDGTADNSYTLVFCSIECARHNGHEPTRMCFKAEYDAVCDGCGFDPNDAIPTQDGIREEL